MNPWSGAEPGNEAMERALFARRARALEPAALPSLDAILRAAEASRETRAARGAQGRAFMAMALAAACMMAAITRLPSTTARGAIVADVDAGAPRPATVSPAAAGATCEMDDEVLVSEERACFAPAPLFSAPPVTAAVAAPLACTATEACAFSTP